jgi:hypothetical protein
MMRKEGCCAPCVVSHVIQRDKDIMFGVGVCVFKPTKKHMIKQVCSVLSSLEEHMKMVCNMLSTLNKCRNPTLAKCGGEAQHLEKVRIWSSPGLPNV